MAGLQRGRTGGAAACTLQAQWALLASIAAGSLAGWARIRRCVRRPKIRPWRAITPAGTAVTVRRPGGGQSRRRRRAAPAHSLLAADAASGWPPAAPPTPRACSPRLNAASLSPAQSTERSLLSAELLACSPASAGSLAEDRRAARADHGSRRSALLPAQDAHRDGGRPTGRCGAGRDGRRTSGQQPGRTHRAALAAAGRTARCARPRRQTRARRRAPIRPCAAGSSSAPSPRRRAALR